MKKICPICHTIEYSYGIGNSGSEAPTNPEYEGGFPGLVYKCTKCGHKVKPEWAGVFNVSLWAITTVVGLFVGLSNMGNISLLIIAVILIIIMPFIGPFLYLPFVNYKEVHEHCHYHGIPYENMPHNPSYHN